MAGGVIVIGVSAQTSTTSVVRFVSCCEGTEILFVGSLSITNGAVYRFIGATPLAGSGGTLQPGACYTVFLEVEENKEGEAPTYPTTPSLALLSFINDQNLGCNDPSCQDCNPQALCECPEGFEPDGHGNCVRETETVAEYSGTLLPIVAGNKQISYSKFGLRLYPDITLKTWPLLGSGSQAAYTVNENNGAGAAVIPTGNVQNQAFGSEVPGCVTGSTGGRLNKAGIWATGFPNNQELSFEFCVDIPGPESKQYVIGIGGDNKVKISIDGSLAVFLDASSSGVTRPFNHWHAFPISLTPGNHTIKLTGLNIDGAAAFAAEIYDITVTELVANLMYPAVGIGNCGSTEAQLEPYILFSTRDYVGQSVPDPTDPGTYSCPLGSTLDECTGVPVCKTIETIELVCNCYMVIPCDGTDWFVSNDPAYEPYVDSFTSVAGPEYTGCAYIIQTDSQFCNDSTVTTVPTDTPCDCTLRCWWVQNTNGFIYVDANDVLQTVSSVEANPYTRICSKIPPIPETGSVNPVVIEIGDCQDNTCPDLCFKLTNCEDPLEIIYSNSDALYQYTFGNSNVVELLGREGCWIVEEGGAAGDDCDCLVDVVVIRSYTECEECIKVPAYKLTSCTDQSVIYTELNLEVFVGKVIKIDCGCYEVELIDFKPTNPQIFKIEGLYEECIDCTRTYYELVDCKGEADNVYTYTDLSAYVGQTVNIENCTECWTVNEVVAPEPIYATAGEVTVTDSHLTCEDCDNDTSCICSTVTNAGPTTRVYTYLNCDNESNNITLEPGETSDRICVKRWTLPGFCPCFLAKYTFGTGTDVYAATIIQGEFLNGFPVYELCGPGDPAEDCGTVSFNGTNWIVYDGNTGDPLYSLPESESESLLCPIGSWENISGSEADISTQECPDICDCVTVTTTITTETGTETVVYNFALVGFNLKEGPTYEDGNGNSMYYDGEVWVLEVNGFTYTLSQSGTECPTGVWSSNQDDAPPLTSNNSCATQIIDPVFSPTDIFKTYGECQHGVCPPPVFRNNRTVRPGYNTPICTPEKYDMITCNFADVMYKLVLEKRYGITNCCPEEDDKWIVKKELIDLQALKDPNYTCSECNNNCDSSSSCSTCNSEN
jgi:hypothetical protein